MTLSAVLGLWLQEGIWRSRGLFALILVEIA